MSQFIKQSGGTKMENDIQVHETHVPHKLECAPERPQWDIKGYY